MHKGVILLMKAEDRIEAQDKANSFMNSNWYGDGNVWDRYEIGGRWTSTLAPSREMFDKKMKELVPITDEIFGYDMKTIEDNRPLAQKTWEELWMKWPSPWEDHYNLHNDWWKYDIVLLKDCIDVVKEWVWDLEKEAQEYRDKMIEYKKLEDEKKIWTMSAHYAWLYRDAKYSNFSFDSNVYDVSNCEAEKLPDDIEWYRAVMVDMHN